MAGRLSAVTVLLCKLGNDGAKSGPEESWSVHGRKSGSYAESVMKQHLIHLNMQCMYIQNRSLASYDYFWLTFTHKHAYTTSTETTPYLTLSMSTFSCKRVLWQKYDRQTHTHIHASPITAPPQIDTTNTYTHKHAHTCNQPPCCSSSFIFLPSVCMFG